MLHPELHQRRRNAQALRRGLGGEASIRPGLQGAGPERATGRNAVLLAHGEDPLVSPFLSGSCAQAQRVESPSGNDLPSEKAFRQ
jgi:hypothetical protein